MLSPSGLGAHMYPRFLHLWTKKRSEIQTHGPCLLSSMPISEIVSVSGYLTPTLSPVSKLSCLSLYHWCPWSRLESIHCLLSCQLVEAGLQVIPGKQLGHRGQVGRDLLRNRGGGSSTT